MAMDKKFAGNVVFGFMFGVFLKVPTQRINFTWLMPIHTSKVTGRLIRWCIGCRSVLRAERLDRECRSGEASNDATSSYPGAAPLDKAVAYWWGPTRNGH